MGRVIIIALQNDILQYFHDKAVAKEIDYLIVSCPYDKCNWTGEYRHFQVSINY